MPKNNIYTKSFYWRNGLKIQPSQNFVEKFKEFYNELLYRSKSRANKPPIDNETATFFINIVLENIITILDFGYDFWWKRMFVMTQKKASFHLGTKYATKRMWNNVKKFSFKLITKQKRLMKYILNKDNKRYMEFLELKKVRYNEIKNYYKELYGKQNEWWTSDSLSYGIEKTN